MTWYLASYLIISAVTLTISIVVSATMLSNVFLVIFHPMELKLLLLCYACSLYLIFKIWTTRSKERILSKLWRYAITISVSFPAWFLVKFYGAKTEFEGFLWLGISLTIPILVFLGYWFTKWIVLKSLEETYDILK